MICNAKLNIGIRIDLLQKEIKALFESDNWLPHFNQSHYEGNWEVLPLRTPGGQTNNPFADLFQHTSFENTALLDKLPEVNAILESLQCEKQSVRLLNLRKGSVIKTHRDYDLAFEMGEARLHFPVFTTEQVEFFVDENFIKMQEGECWYINANLPHRAANHGTTDRIHLVVDCIVNPWLEELFEHSEKQCKTEVKDTEKTKQIIESLRMQNTPTALALANKLESELENE